MVHFNLLLTGGLLAFYRWSSKTCHCWGYWAF